MNNNSVNGTEPRVSHPVLLQAILDTFQSGIHIFHAVRDSNNEIIDFEFVLSGKKSVAFENPAELPGKRLFEAFPAYKVLLESMKQVVEMGVCKTQELHRSSGGGERWYLVSDSKFGDGFVNVWEDITEHKQAEAKIRELNRSLLINNRELAALNSELKTFNSIAATDYTDTLRKLYTNLEFIISNDARNLSDESKANVRRAQSAIQKMKLLTDDIVSYSRIHSYDTDLQLVNIRGMLTQIEEDMRWGWPGIDVKISCKDEMLEIMGYPFLLNLLFHHLVDNAIKFRKEGTMPVIGIECKHSLEPQHPSAIPGTHYNCYIVTDKGIGFDPVYAEDIFKIFYRLHPRGVYKGSGIGLAICRKIMDVHGGFIEAKSEPGMGTSFFCYFPLTGK
jgi:signal transduction histidine kinase